MTFVVRAPGEPIESLVRRFKTAVTASDVQREIRRRRWFLSPGEKRRLKAALADRRRERAEFRLRQQERAR